MVGRSAATQRLQVQLAGETGVPVDVCWDSSSGRESWRWHVMWSDRPTLDGMTAMVDRLLLAASDLHGDALVYLRTVQPVSVALAIVRNVRLGLPPLGEHRTGWELEQHLETVPYPERGTDRDVELAVELCRLVPAGGAQDLADTAARYGLAGLKAAVVLPENVLPLRRPTRP